MTTQSSPQRYRLPQVKNPEAWRRGADRVLTTNMSALAQAQAIQAQADGEPEYVAPSEARGRLVKTGPVGMLPVMALSLFSSKVYTLGHLALLLQAQQMPGPWFGDRDLTEKEKAAGLKRAPRFGRYSPKALVIQIPAALLGWGVSAFYFSAQATGFAWIALIMAAYVIIWTEYYMRRTNRKEVVFVSGLVFGPLRVMLGILKGEAATSQRYDADTRSDSYDPELVRQVLQQQQSGASQVGSWNPLDFGA